MTRFWRRLAWWSTFLALAVFSIWTITSAVRLRASHATCAPVQPLTQLPKLPEASSLAPSRRTPGLIWALNDNGPPLIYGINARGAIVATVEIPGVKVKDWEDLSVGPCPAGSCVYIADIGDNNKERRDVAFYRIPEPAATDTMSAPP